MRKHRKQELSQIQTKSLQNKSTDTEYITASVLILHLNRELVNFIQPTFKPVVYKEPFSLIFLSLATTASQNAVIVDVNI